MKNWMVSESVVFIVNIMPHRWELLAELLNFASHTGPICAGSSSDEFDYEVRYYRMNLGYQRHSPHIISTFLSKPYATIYIY